MSVTWAEFPGTLLLVILGNGVVATGRNARMLLYCAGNSRPSVERVLGVARYPRADRSDLLDSGTLVQLAVDGKRDSDWRYGFIPVLAPLLAAVTAGFFAKLFST